jgi:hypothetical protein
LTLIAKGPANVAGAGRHIYRRAIFVRLVQQLRDALPPNSHADIAEPVERCIVQLERTARVTEIDEHQGRRAWTMGHGFLQMCRTLFPLPASTKPCGEPPATAGPEMTKSVLARHPDLR